MKRTMRIAVDLSDEQSERLRDTADSLGIEPDELALAAFTDWLAQPRDDFRKAAESVLQKNKELYQKFGKALDAANRNYGGTPRRLGD